MKKYLFISFLLFLFSCQEDLNTDLSLKKKKDIKIENAVDFINKTFENSRSKSSNNDISSSNIDSVLEIKNKKGEVSLKIVSFAPKGYMLLHTLDNSNLPRVLYYSDNKFNGIDHNPIVSNMITNFNEKENEFIKVSEIGNTKSTKSQTDPVSYIDIISSKVNPLLTNFQWHQWSPYNNFLNNGTVQNNNAVGCGPIAIGQIIAYHQHFENAPNCFVDWTKTSSESEAVKDGFFNINHLLENISIHIIKYSGSTGSGSTLSIIDDFMVDRGYNTFVTGTGILEFQKGKTELQNNRPLYVQGVDRLGTGLKGHAFVCDGYKTIDTHILRNGVKEKTPAFSTNYVHINWGWKEDNFMQGGDGWSFAEGLNVMTKTGMHFYNVDVDMLCLEPVR